MIQLIFGEKGSGKTKKILEIANRAAEEAKGSVVFIDEDERYMYDLNLSVRFINATEYALSGPKMFYGFLCGIAASDHDLECIFIDSIHKHADIKIENLEDFLERLNRISTEHSVDIVVSISADKEDLGSYINKYDIVDLTK